jgi:hypothetical protein
MIRASTAPATPSRPPATWAAPRRRWTRLWGGAMGLVLVLGFADRAAAEGIAPFGVPVGGIYGFEAPCDRGEVLTGLSLGDAFDAISPQCAIASNPKPKNQGVPARWYGRDPGSGGFQRVTCPDIAPVLLSIRVQTLTDTYSQIKSFRFFKLETFCGVDGSHPSLERIGEAYASINVPGWQLGGGTQFCPAGQVAVGTRGRFQSSGEGLNELGLICGDPKIGSRGLQTMNQAKPAPGKAGDAAMSAASRATGQPVTLNARGTSPAAAVQNKADAASLNPQPLPPKTSPAAQTATPLDPARNRLGAVLLNPQPLPPKPSSAASTAAPLDARNKAGPVLLNPQPLPPGGLQQAPSSLR